MNFIQFVWSTIFNQKILALKLDHFQREACAVLDQSMKEFNCLPRTEQLLADKTIIEQNVVVQISVFCSKEPDSSTEMEMYNHGQT